MARILSVPGANERGGDIAKSVAATLAGELGLLLGGGKAGANRVAPAGDGWDFESLALAGPGWAPDAVPAFRRFAQSSGDFWAVYDPLRPQASQRNVVVRHDREAIAELAVYQKLYPRVGLGGLHEMRMLVCEGPMLLSWVGAWSESPFDARAAWMLEGVGRAARRALRMSRALPSGVAWTGFEAALDALDVEVFVVDGTGRVDFANRAGALRLASDRRAVVKELTASVAPRSAERPFDLHPLRLSGAAPLFLAMRSAVPGRALEARLEHARQRWALTKRQVEVLSLLARGDANKDIATKLSCRPRTVELHVAALLGKAKVESRLQLVAALWG